MNILLLFSRKAEHLLSTLNKQLTRKTDPQFRELERWYHDDPHSLKRSDFDFLNENSIVFDLGGYEGQWTSDIYSRYRCNIHIFEPVNQFAELIRNRFKKNNDISVFQFGLGNEDCSLEIAVDAFASSVINKTAGKSKEIIQIRKFSSFLTEKKLDHIDLVKINIEGSEYDLMDHLSREGIMKNIHGFLIQFHNFVDNAPTRMQNIHSELEKTHRCVYRYHFIWEYWEIKS